MLPRFIAMSVVAEEGLHMAELARYMKSAARVCEDLNIQLVAGDTKVVPKGHVEGLFITTCAVGEQITEEPLGMDRLQSGDKIIASTSRGRHGAAIGASRFNLNPEDLKATAPSLASFKAPIGPERVTLHAGLYGRIRNCYVRVGRRRNSESPWWKNRFL